MKLFNKLSLLYLLITLSLTSCASINDPEPYPAISSMPRSSFFGLVFENMIKSDEVRAIAECDLDSNLKSKIDFLILVIDKKLSKNQKRSFHSNLISHCDKKNLIYLLDSLIAVENNHNK